MSFLRIAPSIKTQRWGLLFVAGLSSLAAGAYATGWATWPVNLGPWFPGLRDGWTAHWPYLWPVLVSWIPGFGELWSGPWVYYHGLIRDAGLMPSFLAHVALVATGGIAAAALAIRLLWVSGGRDSLIHVEGPKLYEGEQAIKQGRKTAFKEIKGDPTGQGIHLHPEIPLVMRREPRNLAFLGMPGSGKTQVMNERIREAMERGDRMVIYDEKKEFTETFHRPETTILIAPWDERSAQWDIASDAYNEIRAELIAARMIPVNDKDPIWGQGARLIFVGAIMWLIETSKKAWGWVELNEFIEAKEEVMMSRFEAAYPKASKFVKAQSKTTDSLLMNLTAALSWVGHAARAWPEAYRAKDRVSIRAWVRNDKAKRRVMILQNDPEYPGLAEPIVNAILAIVTGTLLSMSTSHSRKLWLVLDEIGNLPRNPSLLKWLSLARAKGGRLILGVQDKAMLVEIYGTNVLNAQASMIGTVYAFPVSGMGDTASWVSDSLGKRVVERPNITWQGESDGEQGKSMSFSREELPVVPPSAITGLPMPSPKTGIHGYLAVTGWPVLRLTWPLRPLPQIAEGSVPAAWTLEEPSVPVVAPDAYVDDSDGADAPPPATREIAPVLVADAETTADLMAYSEPADKPADPEIHTAADAMSSLLDDELED